MKLLRLIKRASYAPHRLKRLVRLADAANAERRWAAAATAYQEALGIKPDQPAIWVQYGHSLKEQGFLADAEAAYLRAAALDGGQADTHLQLGHVLKLQGDTARAIAAYEMALSRAPRMEQGRAELADLRESAPGLQVGPGLHLHGRMPPAAGAEAPDPRFQADVAAFTRMPGEVAPSLAALLASHDLPDDFLPRFDAFYYYQAHPAVRQALTAPNRAACLSHFCISGLELGLSFAAPDTFDPAFYLDTYLGDLPFTPGNAYRHWLTIGLLRGWVPNRRQWVRAALGDDADGLDGIDLALFAARTMPNAAQGKWVDHAEHFLAHGAGPGWPVQPTEANAATLAALADRLERSDDDDDAVRAFNLRERIAWAIPGHGGNQMRYAQVLMDRGNVLEAASQFRRRLEQDSPPAFAFLNLSECEERLDAPDQALATLGRARQAHPGDQYLRYRGTEVAQRFFGREWDEAIALARLDRVAEGQARLHAVCAAIARMHMPGSTGPRRPIRRVAIVGHQPLPQCRFYRIDQKAEQLEAAGYDVQVFDLANSDTAFPRDARLFEAAIFFRVPALPDVIEAIQKATELGLVTFYDIDDLIFDPAYPDSLASYGGRISQEEHIGLAVAVPLFDQAMRLCEHGIASTPALADAMRGRIRSGTVFVHPNALGSQHMEFAGPVSSDPLPAAADRPVTVFYGSGTKAHKADFTALIEPALVDLVRRHGSRVAIVLMGDFPDSPALRSIAANVTVLDPVWDIAGYWSVLAGADINLAVLRPAPTTDAKSEIKWLEAAMLGIPSIVSDTATYRAVVRDNETGLICRTAAEWTTALDRLVCDPALRRALGAGARRQAIAEYGQDAMTARVRSMMDQVSAPVDNRPLIVTVNVFYPPQAIGGATRVVHDNVRDLIERAGGRFRFEVFTSIEGVEPYEASSYTQDGVRVTGVGTPDHPDLEERVTDDRMGEVFGDFLDQTTPALVHFHCIQRLTASIVAATAARGIPYVISVHDGWWISDHQFLVDDEGKVRTYDMANPLATLRDCGAEAYGRMVPLRRALTQAEAVLAVSEPFAAIYRDCGAPNVTAVPNGVSDLPTAARCPGPDGKIRLGFVGGLARHKGYDLIRIAIECRPYRNLLLQVIDHAMHQGEIRHERWGDVPVEFRPKWPQDGVGDLYGQIDVLLAPSVWPESYGLVTREALHSGCWVIASDRGSIGECVTPGRNGFVVDVSSADGLADALAQVDGDPARYRASPDWRSKLRQASEQADELAALYGAVLEGRAARLRGS